MPDIATTVSPEALAAANVNPQTGLATDYLNVFNEPLMMIGLAGSDPEILEELADWSPPDYETHFARSGFAARALIIAAYRGAPRRKAFDAASHALAQATRLGVDQLRRAAGAGGDISALASVVAERLQGSIALLDAMIHGRIQGESESESSGDMEADLDVSAAEAAAFADADAAIDALFD